MRNRFDDVDFAKIGQALRRQYQIDLDNVGPKAPHGDILYKGVLLVSRYNVAHEFPHMRQIIDAMVPLMARRMESIFCDSHASADYTVMIKPNLFLPDLPEIIDDAFRSCGGYNGLRMYADGRSIPDRDPYWSELDLD